MQGLSERQYAVHAGLSRGAIQKAKATDRVVLYPDGSIDAEASDARRAETTDPSKTRKTPQPKMKPVPEAAIVAVGDTLREEGLAAPVIGGGTTFLQAKTANEVLKAQERRIRLTKANGLLQQSTLSVLDIALMTGFTSAAHFIRCFAGEHGMPPGRRQKNLS